MHVKHAKHIAIHTEAFGEERERLDFRFLDLAEDAMTIVGHPLRAQRFLRSMLLRPQAFSHFSYWATGRKHLVCDQGVYEEKANMIMFSDPGIQNNHHSMAD
jgi:hypothetical protein